MTTRRKSRVPTILSDFSEDSSTYNLPDESDDPFSQSALDSMENTSILPDLDESELNTSTSSNNSRSIFFDATANFKMAAMIVKQEIV